MNLTEIARKTLEEHFQGRSLELDKKTLKKYKLKKSCFVTLTINRTLRGCIGSLTPTKPLHQEVQENALNAAFRDPRFRPLEESELKK
jgi:AmmeMemoRadiSam system protein A